MEEELDSQVIEQETPAKHVFVAPSINDECILSGRSYTYHSAIPAAIAHDVSAECVLGIDEAGRGPVLGPMVYGLFYLPSTSHEPLLTKAYRFDDSKVLKPAVRSSLMQSLCTPSTDLYKSCGWATRVMSARDISSGMLRPAAKYNLNAQAMDATIDLIKEVWEKGVNIKEIYVDTIGSEEVYQKRLARVFPTISITVAKKADSLYPCVSAASVCAKVTRDAAIEACYKSYATTDSAGENQQTSADAWGSGYPSDGRCTNWMKGHMDPLFGWGNECRFDWGTAKDMLEAKGAGAKVDWPRFDDEEQTMRVTDFFLNAPEKGQEAEVSELASWFGRPVPEEAL